MSPGDRGGQELEWRIRQARRASRDGTLVTYDLRSGVDFSDPKFAAEAIARVVWEADVHAWWHADAQSVSMTPTGSIEILLPAEHHRRLAKAVADFNKDLESQWLAAGIHAFLESLSKADVDWAAVAVAGPALAYVAERTEAAARRQGQLDRLFAQMVQFIRVVPQ